MAGRDNTERVIANTVSAFVASVFSLCWLGALPLRKRYGMRGSSLVRHFAPGVLVIELQNGSASNLAAF